MNAKMVLICITYICMFTSVYIVYGMFEPTLNDKTQIPPKIFALIDIIYFMKLPGATLYTTIADRTGRHKLLVAISLSCFVFFSWTYCILSKLKIGINTLTMINSALLLFSMAGAFPLMESIALNYLISIEGVDRYYHLFLMSEHFGCLIADILYSLLYKRGYGIFYESEHLFVSLIFAILAIICLYFVPAHSKSSRKKAKKISFKEYSYEILKIVTSGYFIVLMVVCLEGVVRRGASSFLPAYMEIHGFDRRSISGLRTIRDMFGIINCLLIRKIREKMNIFAMMNIGILGNFIRILAFNCFRTVPYGKRGQIFLYVIAEISKGLYSSFFLYSITIIANLYSNDWNRAIFQGINSGVYNGLGATLAGILGTNVFSKDPSKLQKPNFILFFSLLFYTTVICLFLSLVVTFINMNKLRFK